MQIAIVLCFLGTALAAPQRVGRQGSLGLVVQARGGALNTPAPPLILKDERTTGEGGAYAFHFETENGIVQSETGNPGVAGGSAVQGSYSYVLEDGSVATVEYTADENGFRVQSPLVPVAPAFPHPIPEHVANNIRVAEEYAAQGVQFDQRGFRIN